MNRVLIRILAVLFLSMLVIWVSVCGDVLDLKGGTTQKEWNNAVYHARQRQALACTPQMGDVAATLFAASWMFCLVGMLPWELLDLDGELAALVVALALAGVAAGVYGILVGLSEFNKSNSKKCREARAETQRLEAIGTAKGWTYKGKLID